jgi:hypothetical protein
MMNFLEYVLLHEGVNPQLVAAQLGKRWRNDRVPEEEVEARLKNTSTNTALNLDSIVTLISDADPSKNKEFFPWILMQYANRTIRLPEDGHVLMTDLTYYATIKQNSVLKRVAPAVKTKLGLQPKQNPLDITTLDRKTFGDVVDAARDITDGNSDSKRKQVATIKQEGAESIYKEDGWQIFEVTEGAAAVYYAKGTKWCTSSEHTANYYIRQGPLYIIFADGKPYAQLHVQSNQFMDAKDNKIKDVPDEIAQALIDRACDSDKEKCYVARHCEQGSILYDEYIHKFDEQLWKMVRDAKLRHEVDCSVYSEEDYVSIDGQVSFCFPTKDFLKDIENDYKALQNINSEVSIGSEDLTAHTHGDTTCLNFEIQENGHASDDVERLDDFLKSLKSEFNDDTDYFKIKNELYGYLVNREIMKPKAASAEFDNLKLKYFEVDDDEYETEGLMNFQASFYDLATDDDLAFPFEKLKVHNGEHVLLVADTTPLVKLFDDVLRKRNLDKLVSHKKSQWLFDKPKLPEGYFRTQKAAKTIVQLVTDHKKDTIVMRVKIETHLHKNDEDEVKATLEKVKALDQVFVRLLAKAHDIFMKEILPTLKPTS